MDENLLHQLDQDWHEAQQHIRTRMRRMLRDAGGPPVGGAGFRLLALVLTHGAQSPADLAKRLEIRTSTMTAHLDRLEELGWVSRQPLPRGTARIQVEVTPEGRTAYEEYVVRRQAVVAEFLAPLGDREIATLATLLHRLVEDATGDSGAPLRLTPDPSEVH